MFFLYQVFLSLDLFSLLASIFFSSSSTFFLYQFFSSSLCPFFYFCSTPLPTNPFLVPLLLPPPFLSPVAPGAQEEAVLYPPSSRLIPGKILCAERRKKNIKSPGSEGGGASCLVRCSLSGDKGMRC